MWEGPNLFRALEDDWRRVAASPSARAALRRWAQGDDVLVGVAHPAALVERCHSRHDAFSAGPTSKPRVQRHRARV
jgi:hypothetical protein